jgi:hypothetical protein
MMIMVEEPLLYDESDRANKGQLTEADTEIWKEIGRLMRENRKIVMEIGNGESNPFYWREAQEFPTEILNKVGDAERVQGLGGEQAILSPR